MADWALSAVAATERAASPKKVEVELQCILGKIPGPGQPAQILALRAEDVDGTLQAEYWVLI